MNRLFFSCIGIFGIIIASDQNDSLQSKQQQALVWRKDHCFVCNQPGADVFLTPFNPSAHRQCHDPLKQMDQEYLGYLKNTKVIKSLYPSAAQHFNVKQYYEQSIRYNNTLRRYHLQVIAKVNQLIKDQGHKSIQEFSNKNTNNEKLDLVFQEAFKSVMGVEPFVNIK